MENQSRTLECKVETQFCDLEHIEIIWVWELQGAEALIALLTRMDTQEVVNCPQGMYGS